MKHFLNKLTFEVVARKGWLRQLWDPHHVGCCRCGEGGLGREGEKAASDSNSPPLALKWFTPTHHTWWPSGWGSGVSFLSEVHMGSRGRQGAGPAAVIVKVEWWLLIKPGAGNQSSLHLRSGGWSASNFDLQDLPSIWNIAISTSFDQITLYSQGPVKQRNPLGHLTT